MIQVKVGDNIDVEGIVMTCVHNSKDNGCNKCAFRRVGMMNLCGHYSCTPWERDDKIYVHFILTEENE